MPLRQQRSHMRLCGSTILLTDHSAFELSLFSCFLFAQLVQLLTRSAIARHGQVMLAHAFVPRLGPGWGRHAASRLAQLTAP